MSAVVHDPFAEQFRDAESAFLSPAKVSEAFGLRVQELAEGAHVHRNTPTARPYAPQLQRYLKDMVRVLAVASDMTGDVERAVFLLRNEPLRVFDYRTAEQLVQDGRADDVVAYLRSLAAGAAG